MSFKLIRLKSEKNWLRLPLTPQQVGPREVDENYKKSLDEKYEVLRAL